MKASVQTLLMKCVQISITLGSLHQKKACIRIGFLIERKPPRGLKYDWRYGPCSINPVFGSLQLVIVKDLIIILSNSRAAEK